MSKVIIVGGGIGGLTAAAAFHQQGWDVEVLEQAPEIAEVGAGISLWSNALRALDVIGLGAQARDRARAEASAGIRESKGGWLSRADVAAIRDTYGLPILLHRADLLDLLRAAVPESALRPGISVREARSDGTVVHSAGSSTADLIVGADGLRSVVRRAVCGEIAPRYAGYTAWRVLVTPTAPIGDLAETWGRGERFGYAALADGRVYCYATANLPEGTRTDGRAELRRRFGRWHDPIPGLLAAADDDAVLQHDIYALPPLKTYVAERIALVGDAAHAMTPNLGQGACQAIEDAIVLARVAKEDGDLTRYDRLRRPRTQMIVARSGRIGQVAQLSWPPVVAVRNAMLKLVPAAAQVKALGAVVDWTP
ncbi:FAD-dependent monooxygenase [Nocardia sp. NPDC051832]|uniref:FAD-dependent monooxygenase n=1 Tax=Nocardia sp. NPDC051832 TaxID=3155673 RepID=UPI00341D63B9